MNTSMLSTQNPVLSFIALGDKGFQNHHKFCAPAFNSIHGFTQNEMIYPISDASLPHRISVALQEDETATGKFTLVTGPRMVQLKAPSDFKPDWIGVIEVAPFLRFVVITPNRRLSVFSKYFQDSWKVLHENPSPLGLLDLLDILLPDNHLLLIDFSPAKSTKQWSFNSAEEVANDANAMHLLRPILDKLT